jgi:DNA-directed RNA polymerase specialized sigma24 family protein
MCHSLETRMVLHPPPDHQPGIQSRRRISCPLGARVTPLKKNWSATPAHFQTFLAWLDEGIDSGGARYVEMRRRLVMYFVRKRCAGAEELADETLTRVSRRLSEEGHIPDAPARYCYVVARFVFLESLRDPVHAPLPSGESLAPDGADDGDAAALECLDHSLAQLTSGDRDLIVHYYAGEPRKKAEQRRHLAQRLGLSANALAIRASRIRARLEQLLARCLAER